MTRAKEKSQMKPLTSEVSAKDAHTEAYGEIKKSDERRIAALS